MEFAFRFSALGSGSVYAHFMAINVMTTLRPDWLKDFVLTAIEANRSAFVATGSRCGKMNISWGEWDQYSSIMLRSSLIFSISSFPLGRETGIEKSESRICSLYPFVFPVTFEIACTFTIYDR
jgi:hypothetical protein